MTLLELVKYLRTNLLDDTGGQDVDWEGFIESNYDSIQLRWKNEELVSNINEAIKQVYRRTNPIKAIYTLSALANIDSYTLPSYILEIKSGRRGDGRSIEEKSIEDLFKIQDPSTNTGNIEFYIPDKETNTLVVYPVPTANETLTFLVHRLPLVNQIWTSPNTSIELREEYQIPMLFYAAALCYLKDEANTYDPNRSASFMVMFDREFPFTSAYSNIRKARSTNRPVKYGGL